MNGRILELAKNPDQFQIKDLELLNSEINKHPYIQSLRALHLLGTHRLMPENYSNELSITAAYTTDKKILYQLINSVDEAKSSIEIVPETVVESEVAQEETHCKFTQTLSKNIELPKPVFVNGELNRILFEGEEDFLEKEIETIDLESTIESGKIVTQKLSSENLQTEVPVISKVEDAETFSKEKLVEEEIISTEKTTIEDESELSFHALAEFLPEVKITSPLIKEEIKEIEKPVLNKHETEMQKLIAEVEAKMKASKKLKTVEVEETIINSDVNFSETQEFELSKPKEKEVAINEQVEIETPEISKIQTEEKETIVETNSSWKPMSFSANTPDALISTKTEEVNIPKIINETHQEKDQLKQDNLSEERPIFNVSFFSENLSALKNKEVLKEEKSTETIEDSNVPQFINTWQSWLKIDRTKEESKEKIEISITEIKNKVIEDFIEKEPKISKLKEESDFVIKERNDDISHLMTETLANIYTEQKLYAKAIKAFGILSEKYPDKKTYFDDKIKQIKELRQNK
ncbi:hypothetical protein [Kaistella sp.]|uniref:hypothetical protein n=1 Tax=Kaistella sp. TaxID=2782235 RepID=UPI003C3CFDC0